MWRRRLLSSHSASTADDLGSLKNSFKTLRKKIYADVDGMKKPAAGRRWQRVRYHVCHGRRWWLTLHRHRIWEE